MIINKALALKLWSDVFGNSVLWATDCFGTWIYRDDYNATEITRKRPNGDNKYYNYGWTIDHIMPISKGGKDHWNNFEPMHYLNNLAKAGEISFKIHNESFQVVKCDLVPDYGYGIKNQLTNERVDWKATQLRWYV